MRRSSIVVLVLALFAAGCGGSGSSPRVAPVPTDSSTPAPTSAAGGLDLGVLSAWKDCASGFQCAKLNVALDAHKPSLGRIDIALTRHRATRSPRIGSLLVNPGGPGGSAVDFLHDALTAFPKVLRQQFDLVAFDPRGVGHTAPVRCLSTRELDDYFHIDPLPDNPAELAAIDAGNKKLAAACQAKSGRLLPYTSTTIVAEDMERVRIAVGDPKLTYLGYSYGTAIGTAYLDRFPTHVRAMVLDGAIDPTLTWDQFSAGQAKGFDVAFNAFLHDCQRTTCDFRSAVTGDLFQAYDALARQVETHPLPTGSSRKVGPAEFSYGVGQALYSKSLWPTLGQALAEAQHGQGTTLLALNDEYLERTSSGYTNILEANNAVNCVDRPWPRTDAPFQALAKQVEASAPRFGPAIALSGLSCSVWPVAPVSTPHRVTAPGSPAVLVIGTIRDPATPYAWAQGLAAQLSHGILLTHDGDGHTAFRNGAPDCITQPVDDYLISLVVPRAATC